MFVVMATNHKAHDLQLVGLECPAGLVSAVRQGRGADSPGNPPTRKTRTTSVEQQINSTESLAPYGRELLHDMLSSMLLARRFEEKVAEAYQMGSIGGFCHLYIGQEAVAVGAIRALRSDDYVFTAYRDHAQALVRGIEPGVQL